MLGEKKSEHWVPAHMTFWTQSWRPFLIFYNFRHFEAKIIHDSSIHLCKYSWSEAQIHSWRASWWNIGFLVVNILKIQPFKVSVLYAVFAIAAKLVEYWHNICLAWEQIQSTEYLPPWLSEPEQDGLLWPFWSILTFCSNNYPWYHSAMHLFLFIGSDTQLKSILVKYLPPGSIHVNPPSFVRSLRHFGIAENLRPGD